MSWRRSLSTPEPRTVQSFGPEESHLLRGVVIGTLLSLPCWGVAWVLFSICSDWLRG